MKKLPVGVSEFAKIANGEYYFIDKTLFIRDLFNEGSDIVLFTRPRRFGKTLNMRMLYSFLNNREDNRELFNGSKIEKTPSFAELNQYPVIYMSFKDIKDREWRSSFLKIRELIVDLYTKFTFLKSKLEESEVEYYNKILGRSDEQSLYENAVAKLSNYLYDYHGQKIWVLLDEYDVPIQSGYMRGFYDDVVSFMRNFMSAAFKDNPFLYKGVITGIYRVSKESIFSGLNNLKIYTILEKHFSEHFGFTESEVEKILSDFGLHDKLVDVKRWYDGHIFGEQGGIYNPWSIINYVADTRFQAYWVNTSSNDLIKEQVEKNNELETELPLLLEGKEITKQLHADTSLREIIEDESAVWNLLVFAGYLRARFIKADEDELYYKLSIPNIEVRSFFKYTVGLWLKSKVKLKENSVMQYMRYLLEGDPDGFVYYLKETVMQVLSYFDTGDEPEKVYKVFTLGLLTIGANGYTVRSEKESGFGRYDVAIYPKDKSKYAAVIEFKMKEYNETLEAAASRALAQIEDKHYVADLKAEGVNHLLKFGIAIHGKEMAVKYSK